MRKDYHRAQDHAEGQWLEKFLVGITLRSADAGSLSLLNMSDCVYSWTQNIRQRLQRTSPTTFNPGQNPSHADQLGLFVAGQATCRSNMSHRRFVKLCGCIIRSPYSPYSIYFKATINPCKVF